MCARTGILVLLILLLPLGTPAQEAPLAVLMARQGEVTVQRAGEALAGEFGMHLDLGDEIRTGAESSADILFSTGQALQLGANGSLVVQASEEGTSSRVFASADRLIKLRDARGTSVISGVRGGNSAEIIAVSPRRNARVSERPVFQWSGGEGELELTIEHGGEVHWQGAVEDSGNFAYPSDGPAFVGGETYSWRVRTSDPLALSPAESQTAFFGILTPEEEAALDETLAGLKAVEVAASTRAVMTAGVLFDHGLVDEAIATIDRAMETSPDAEGLAAVRDNLRGAYWP
jgi:hypothetical protein